MADHARWVTAAEPALGWDTGTYLGVFAQARQHAARVTLEDSPLAMPLLEIARDGWRGTATDVLRRLEGLAADAPRHRDWPRSASALSARLRALAPDLRLMDVEIDFLQRSKGHRELSLRLKAEKTVTSVTASPTASQSQFRGDGVGDGDSRGDGVVVTGDGAPIPGNPHQQAKSDGGDGSDGDSRLYSATAVEPTNGAGPADTLSAGSDEDDCQPGDWTLGGLTLAEAEAIAEVHRAEEREGRVDPEGRVDHLGGIPA